jgi:hypothetical protein
MEGIRLIETAPFRLEDGSTISIIIDPRLEEKEKAGGIEEYEPRLRDSIDKVGRILPDIKASLMEIRKNISADEICLEFGVALNSNGSIIIASSGIQASFNISVTWVSHH